jgi:hypothetical protein
MSPGSGERPDEFVQGDDGSAHSDGGGRYGVGADAGLFSQREREFAAGPAQFDDSFFVSGAAMQASCIRAAISSWRTTSGLLPEGAGMSFLKSGIRLRCSRCANWQLLVPASIT